MGKIIALIIIAAIAWFAYNNNGFDLNNIKEKSIKTLEKEKTINLINSRRDQDQAEINKVINGELN